MHPITENEYIIYKILRSIENTKERWDTAMATKEAIGCSVADDIIFELKALEINECSLTNKLKEPIFGTILAAQAFYWPAPRYPKNQPEIGVEFVISENDYVELIIIDKVAEFDSWTRIMDNGEPLPPLNECYIYLRDLPDVFITPPIWEIHENELWRFHLPTWYRLYKGGYLGKFRISLRWMLELEDCHFTLDLAIYQTQEETHNKGTQMQCELVAWIDEKKLNGFTLEISRIVSLCFLSATNEIRWTLPPDSYVLSIIPPQAILSPEMRQAVAFFSSPNSQPVYLDSNVLHDERFDHLGISLNALNALLLSS